MNQTISDQPRWVDYQNDAGVATVTLTNAPANAYSYAMMQQLDTAILDARMDDSVHVIVLRGAGEKFFCAGADISQLQTMPPQRKYYFCLHANETLCRLEATPKLTIAALNGHAVGGGLEVALACDLRVAAAGAGKLGLPEVNLGVLPGTGGTQRLARAVGRSRAIELMATGELMTFEQGQHLGLVNKLLPQETFWQAALAYAREFTPPGRASQAVGLIKRAVCSGSDGPLESGLALERELQQRLFVSQDAKEGLAAYSERRKPVFSGR